MRTCYSWSSPGHLFWPEHRPHGAGTCSPKAESSSPGRAGAIRTMPCKRSHHYLGHAWGSARCRRARCLLPGWSGCRGNWAPVTIRGRGEVPWAAVPRSTEGLHCLCHKRRSAGESSTTSTDTGTGALKSHLGIYIPPRGCQPAAPPLCTHSPLPFPSYHTKQMLISKKRLISCNKIRTFRKLIG